MRRTFCSALFMLPGALIALSAGCRGPEQAEHRPVQGVDTEETEVKNPYDRRGTAPPPAPMTEASASVDTHLGQFVDELDRARSGAPGPIAVFPALSKNGTGETVVTGLGEHLMLETADRLRAAGAPEVLAGPRLVQALRQANRGLDALTDVEDIYTLAERIGADYIVFGTADARATDPIRNENSLEIRWNAMRLADLAVVSEFRARALGAEGQALYGMHRATSDWRIGARASTTPPSLEQEMRILGGMLARKLGREQTAALRDRRVRIEPVVITGRGVERADLQQWASEFERKLAEVTRTLETDGDRAEAERRALASVPVTIAGTEYANFGEAADAYRALRTEVNASSAGQLATDLATSFAEQLREALDGRIALVSADSAREEAIWTIRREARAARGDGSVDGATVAHMKAHGTEFLLTSSLRRDLEAYKFRVTMLDLESAESVPYSIDFEPSFTAALDRALAR